MVRPSTTSPRSRWRSLALPLVLLCVAGLAAQKPSRTPNTAKAALAAFAKVADKPEPQRAQALARLGRFSTDAVNQVLLSELTQAKTAPYRSAVVRALGTRKRKGALAPLLAIFDQPATDRSLAYSLARAIGRQGDPAVPEFARRLEALGQDRASRDRFAPLVQGLEAVGTPAAFDALLAAAKSRTDYERSLVLRALAKAPASEALTAIRLEAARASYATLRFAALEQLAAAKHPEVKNLALAAWAEQKKLPGNNSYYATQLAQVFAKMLGPDTFGPFVSCTGIGYNSADQLLKTVGKQVDDIDGFVPWLLKRGLKSKIPSERIVTVRLLSESKAEAVSEAMLKLVTAKDAGLAQLAVRALSERGDKRAVPFLRRVAKGRDQNRRLDALLGLHALLQQEPSWHRELEDMLSARDAKLRALAMDLLADLKKEEVLPEVYKNFTHKNWLVRAAAYDFCRLVRSLRSVDPLIARVDVEKGRLREDCLDALKAITSYRLPSGNRWRSWWQSSKATFKMPSLSVTQPKQRRRAAAATVSSFFDIPLVSDQVIFIMDISGSMSAGMGTVSASGAASNTRIKEAKRQLSNVVQALPKTAVFNLIYFESRITALGKKARKAGKRAKKEALQSVARLQPRGGTNIHDALERAFQDEDVDTIYLLSDGSPSAGKITDPVQLAAEVARWNRTRRIRIHTVAIGSKSTLMEQLAKDSGGIHRHVQ